MSQQTTNKTIDCTPTWRGVMNILIAALQDGNAEGQKAAKTELFRMADCMDHNVECHKEIAEKYDTLTIRFDKTTQQATEGEFNNGSIEGYFYKPDGAHSVDVVNAAVELPRHICKIIDFMNERSFLTD